MAIFTFILEYHGGTYVSQVRADTIDDAIPIWAQALPVNEIAHLGPKLKKQLVDRLANDEYDIYGATPLDGVVNAWCINVPLPMSAKTILNAVKTDES